MKKALTIFTLILFLSVLGSAQELKTVIDALGTRESTITIYKQYAVTVNTTVPANITLEFLQGGSVLIATTKTLTINSDIEAGLYKIFEWDGTGKIVLGTGAVKEIYPQWWGASPTAVVAVNNAAFVASIAALPNGGSWRLPSGAYDTSAIVTFTNKHQCNIHFDGSIHPTGCSGILLDNMTLSQITGIRVLSADVLDWTNGRYALKLKHFGRNTLNISHLSGFEFGLYLDGDIEGVSYNKIHMDSVYNCEFGMYFRSINAGYVNENEYSVGRISLSNAVYLAETGSYAVYFQDTPSHVYNNHTFYSPCFEGNHNGVGLASVNYIVFIQPRFEGVDDNWLQVHAGGVGHLVWIMGETNIDFTKIHLGEQGRNLTIIGAGSEDSNYKTLITDETYGGMSWITRANPDISMAHLYGQMVRGLIFEDFWGVENKLNKGYEGADASAVAAGTYRAGAVYWNTNIVIGQPMFWTCSGAGTMDADPAGMTATTSIGSKEIDVIAGDINDLLPGQYIDIAGGDSGLQINYLDIANDKIWVTVNCTADRVAQALTFHNATWVVSPNY